MLVLRRRAGECLLIGDDVEIELLSINAQGAKIGIRAPKETVILRKELKVTREQNEAAARALAPSDFSRAMEKLREDKGACIPLQIELAPLPSNLEMGTGSRPARGDLRTTEQASPQPGPGRRGSRSSRAS
jgi:carbon storage regulator